MARRSLVFGALLVALAVLAGAATIGRAATNGTVLAEITSVLNDNTSALVLGTPTPGKNIGYTYKFTNTGSNTINHLVLDAFISGSSTGSPKVGAVRYFTVSDPTVSCSAGASLSCTDNQLAAGAFFTMTVIFSTDPNAVGGPNGDKIFPFFTGTYSPQSLNQTNNRNPDTKQFSADNSSSIRFYADPNSNTLAQSLALPTDGLNVGNAGQFAATVQMPTGFLQGNKYVGVTLQTLTGAAATPPAACTTCAAFLTKTTIPLATSFTTTGPFGDGTTTDTHYFTWTIFVPGALLPTNFKPTGVWHTDNAGNNGGYLPTCALDANNNALPPTAAPGLCVFSIVQSKRTKDVTYTGIGVNNGTNWSG